MRDRRSKLRRVEPHGVRMVVGPRDIVGDVHGCLEELTELLSELGYRPDAQGAWRHPARRRLVFLGDLVDRGPDSVGVLDLVERAVRHGALLLRGNHDDKLLRWLEGRDVKISGGLSGTIQQLEALPEDVREDAIRRYHRLLSGAPLWALLERSSEDHDVSEAHGAPGQGPGPEYPVAVAHAAWHPSMIGGSPGKTRAWCLYGPTDGLDQDGRPRRLDWRTYYPEDGPRVITGHTAYDGPVEWRNGTVCIDTACAYGGRLSALRWPSGELVQVESKRTWYEHPTLGEEPGLIDPAEVGVDAVARVRWQDPPDNPNGA